MEIRNAGAVEEAALRSLLAANGLPVEDLGDARVDFLVAWHEGRVLGGIGVERHGDSGLLRSLVVDDEVRGTGLGARLVSALETRARQSGLQRLVLLTQTAKPFFAARGYDVIERDAVPADLRGSAQFRSLCPASATCMAKTLVKRVLFVCVENANRSQMAEAFARIHGGDGVDANSAGSRPSGVINPKAVRFMSELGYDLAAHASKSLAQVEGEFDAVITMGCGDDCPWVPAKRREDWGLPDPRDMEGDDYRAVRDEISRRVQALLAAL